MLQIGWDKMQNLEASKITRLRINELQQVLHSLALTCESQIMQASTMLGRAISAGNKILICGNGGSAADSQHFATELVSSFSRDISRAAISAIALTTDTSVLTAYSNDFTFEKVFERQVQAHGRLGDVLILITTSGSSVNCILAAQEAKKLSMNTIALTRSAAEISNHVDVAIEVPSENTQHIQECHMVIYHIIAELLEKSLPERFCL